MIMSDEYKKTYSKVWELFLRWLSSDRCVETYLYWGSKIYVTSNDVQMDANNISFLCTLTLCKKRYFKI